MLSVKIIIGRSDFKKTEIGIDVASLLAILCQVSVLQQNQRPCTFAKSYREILLLSGSRSPPFSESYQHMRNIKTDNGK